MGGQPLDDKGFQACKDVHFPSILPRKGGLIPVRKQDQKVGADLQILHSPATHALSFFARRPAHDWVTAPGESEYADVLKED